jgi:hypothetical protein
MSFSSQKGDLFIDFAILMPQDERVEANEEKTAD